MLVVALRCGQGRMLDWSYSWSEVLIVVLRCGQGRMLDWSYSGSEVLIVVQRFGQGRMLDWSARPEVGHSRTSNDQSWAWPISWSGTWCRLSVSGQDRSRFGMLGWHHSNTSAKSLVQIGSRQMGGGGGGGGLGFGGGQDTCKLSDREGD